MHLQAIGLASCSNGSNELKSVKHTVGMTWTHERPKKPQGGLVKTIQRFLRIRAPAAQPNVLQAAGLRRVGKIRAGFPPHRRYC
jgi:hypothetical protein